LVRRQGFTATFAQLAIAVSPALYGAVADASGSYRTVWAALSGVLLVAFVPAALVRDTKLGSSE
jgi:cyanate permease